MGKLGWRDKGLSGRILRGAYFHTKGFSMLKIGDQDAVNLLRFFDDLPNPRSKVNRLHRELDVPVGIVRVAVGDGVGVTVGVTSPGGRIRSARKPRQ